MAVICCLSPGDTNYRVLISLGITSGWLAGTINNTFLILAAGHLGPVKPETVEFDRMQGQFN
jgi:hypothetical protein